jgi:glycosyltransferase involved in cell wall biosynthesis
MSAPKISVLIPVYNGGAFLAECINSVLAQGFTDYELLISDDCSTDGTRAVIEHFAAQDQRIRWWTNPANFGQAVNINRCLAEARGEFVKFVFADDKLLEPSALRRMAAILESDPSVSLVGSASHVIDVSSHLIQVREPFPVSGTREGFSVILRCLEHASCWWNNIVGEATVVMFRRSQSRRGFDPRYLQVMDLEMWIHLLEQGRFAYLAEPLSAFRLHPNQQSEINRQHGVDIEEHSRLLRDNLAKPWLRESIAPQLLFNQIYNLRKYYGDQSRLIVSEIMEVLGRGRYARYWLRRKISRPFIKLKAHSRSITGQKHSTRPGPGNNRTHQV